MPGNGHVRFGGAGRRNDRPKGRDRAPARPLPPVGWADVVTKRDLLQFEERIDLRFEAVEARLSGQISDLRAEFRGELNHLSNRVTALVVTGLVGVGGLAFAAVRLT